MILATLLVALAVEDPVAATAAPIPSYPPHPCGTTIMGAVRKTIAADERLTFYEAATHRGYGLAFFGVPNGQFGLSRWLKRRGAEWCVLGYAGDDLSEDNGTRYGVPTSIATRLGNEVMRLVVEHRGR